MSGQSLSGNEPVGSGREFVDQIFDWAEGPKPTAEVLRQPPLAGPGSPVKGYAIPLTSMEIELFMDNFGDDDELQIDNPVLHDLFPHVVEAMFIGADFEEEREIFAQEVLVPVPNDHPNYTSSSTPSGNVTRYWRAIGVVMGRSDNVHDLDMSGTGSLVEYLQRQLGVETQPGWYELTDDGGPSLTSKKLRKICKKAGSKSLVELFKMHEGWD